MKFRWLAAIFPFLLTSCTLETSGNGDLDGFWQLTQLDTLSTGGTTDMRERNAFWAVQHQFLEIKHPHGDVRMNVIFSFEQTKDSLILTEPFFNNRDASDIKIDDPSQLLDFAGIENVREAFFVATLNGSKMELQSKRYLFHFRRY